MSQAQKDYAALFALSKKIRLLDSISGLLEWDQETHMPAAGAGLRSEQVELMASLIHKEKTSKKFSSLLQKLIDLDTGSIAAKDLNLLQQAALREWRRDYLKAVALPNAFVKRFAKLSSESMAVWAKARKENSFKFFSPYLEKIIEMSKEKAEYLGYKDHPYDALLDCFEPHMTCKELNPLFEKVRQGITELLKKIQSAKQVDDSPLHGKFSEEKQLEFGKNILIAMGYDLKKGRIDLSTHPFSMSLHPSDSRVTTRIHTTSLFDCISTLLHEGGHSLYEMGMLPEYYGSPLCEPVSLGIHESQSRFWETRIGQSKSFWEYFLPELKKVFKGKLEDISLDQFYRMINKVEPTYIRVESDEVTYSLHVILRYEMEKGLIEGSIKVSEIPEAWNQKMKKYLGITPRTDTEGCLQDVHWSMGGFGYFPTYSLGNLYAAHFFEAFEEAHPNWEDQVSKGNLIFLKEWLNEMIHKHGRTYTASELLKRIQGTKLSQTPYLDYLNNKYRQIYRFKD